MLQVNPDMISMLEEAGLTFVGKDESGKRMEVGFLCFLLFPFTSPQELVYFFLSFFFFLLICNVL